MENAQIDPRKTFGRVLVEIGRDNPRVLAVSCDSASGSGMADFIKTFPDRIVETGISEQNAIGVCAGLAERGFIPVVAAITPFITMRCYEQVRNDVGYAKANVKIVGSGGGLAYATLGSTHQAIEDLCLMRSIPNMTVLNPGDAYEVEMALRKAVEHPGPVYIRMPRHPSEYIVDPARRSFALGVAEELHHGEEVALIATGTLVKEAQRAVEVLRVRGIKAGLVDVHTLKPLDVGTVRRVFRESRLVVTVEEHSVIGGLGSAVAEVAVSLSGSAPLCIIGLPDGAAEVGPYRELLDHHGLTGEKLADRVVAEVRRLEGGEAP